MKALSLTQPWASLVAIGSKKIETRSWSTKYRGPIAIHAAKGFPKWAKALCQQKPFGGALMTGLHLSHPDYIELSLPFSAIVAVGKLSRVVPTEDMSFFPQVCLIGDGYLQTDRISVGPAEKAFGDYTSGRFAWVFDDIRILTDPIPCKGALGLWTVPEEIEQRIMAETNA